MRRRNRNGKYAAFVHEFAELYVENGRNAAATAQAIRERYEQFPSFHRDLISDWLRMNCHGFADEVAEAEKRLGLETQTEMERWLRDEMMRMEERKRRLEEGFDNEMAEGHPGRAMRFGHEIVKMSRVIRDLQRDYLAYRQSPLNRKESDLDAYQKVLEDCLRERPDLVRSGANG